MSQSKTNCHYAELQCKTNFSFLEGASHPEEMVARASELGYSALAITDRNSLAGVVRAHTAAKAAGVKLLVGAEITPHDGPAFLLYAPDLAGYRRLCRLLTHGRRGPAKANAVLPSPMWPIMRRDCWPLSSPSIFILSNCSGEPSSVSCRVKGQALTLHPAAYAARLALSPICSRGAAIWPLRCTWEPTTRTSSTSGCSFPALEGSFGRHQ